MHDVLAVVAVASLAFVGTMFDNYFAFAAQLVVTERSRFRRVSWAQALGVASLVLVAGATGSLLAPIPLRWVGLLAVAPWALAAHAWRHRADEPRAAFRRGALTTFAVTLALGGDNLAVWIPLLRARGVGAGALTVGVFALWEVLFVATAGALAGHPRVVAWGTRRGPGLVPWVYLLLGVLVLVECRTLA
ncbi:MAG: cadmium resistance transporter [Acidobacteriota bacterium]|nr:cadmium resistance transporter [Acidobacteriota bacterium]